MVESPLVRIVILNYNESQFTIDLLKQLEKQSFKNYEIIVVDNASNKEQKKLLQDHLPQNIFTIYSEKNLGYSGGNNLGLRYKTQHQPDFYLVLNNDLIIKDEKFIHTLLQDMILEGENVVASSPLVDTISSNLPLEEQIQVRKILSKWQTVFVNLPVFKPFVSQLNKKFLYAEQMPYLGKNILCDSINGAAFIIESNFLKSINYLDEGTFLYYEEIILGKQILNSGKKCLLNGKTSVIHLQGVSTKSSGKKTNTKMEKFKYESLLYYLRKYENMNFLESFLFKFLSNSSILLKKIFYKLGY